MGIDMTQFDQMGYKLVGGEKPVKDQVLAGPDGSPMVFMDTPKNGEQRTSTRGGQYSSCTFNQATGQCEEDQDEDPFFDPLTTQISLTTGTNYQGDQYSMNMYGGGGGGTGGAGGGGGAGGASGSAAGQSENVTLDVRASGIVAGDYNKGYATSDGLVMDLQALKELAAKVDPAAAKKATAYDQVLVKAADLKSVPEVESQIKALGYETSSYEDMRKSLEEQSRAIQLILGGIGAVSLLVAAIGIANTMVMSVTERTREIGIMKALGCYVRDIRVMFLAEAGAIRSSAGLIGCVLSGLISLGISVVGALYAGGMSGGMSGGMVSGARQEAPAMVPVAEHLSGPARYGPEMGRSPPACHRAAGSCRPTPLHAAAHARCAPTAPSSLIPGVYRPLGTQPSLEESGRAGILKHDAEMSRA